MAQRREIGGRAAAELVLRLSRAALGEGFVEELTSAQWMALRYFSRANRFSRTVSAFAEFRDHARDRIADREGSYQARLSCSDPLGHGRPQCARRTDRQCEGDPGARPLRGGGACRGSAAGRLRGQLVKLLERMLGDVARQRGRPSLGICASCAHLRNDKSCGSHPRYRCGLLNEPLAAKEIEQICISFEPDKTSAVRSVSARKLAQ